ncbi:benzoate transporter [Aeromicrobium sp. PE09-221]|uniref:benzoate/H(+) symporter BenE family transporter n=1 Tax=Aeromicrobium sp. PE09-221 TaxID=1898043 RepID=UPI000B3E5FFD|nr:benzoate/H(+) symporter BenE family transporter [Aeromicrobium sp. PE09-221]OUZ12536.1 benzoate transporter [Aeromicrobium sp. PE09-221]
MREETRTPVVAGLVTAAVGFTSSFAVVLAGLTSVGASPAQAASGLMVLCVTQGVAAILLARRYRIPVTIAWSTPGAALLATTGAVSGGWPSAVGAFLVVGLLIIATAAIRPLADLVRAIPASVAQAMLAGVLVPLCLVPVTATAERPGLVGPVVLIWLALIVLAPRWAAPAALVVAVVAAIVFAEAPLQGELVPALSWTTPTFSIQALVSIALPLYLVTMAAQNVPGAAVLTSFGYTLPWRASLIVTGLGTAAGAPAGSHAINLAAISAALSASPEAGRDPSRRWIAAVTTGGSYLVIAPLAALLTAVVVAAPAQLIAAAAGLALLATLASSLRTALTGDDRVEPAIITFLVAASGVSVAGIGAAFWALVAGITVHLALRLRR